MSSIALKPLLGDAVSDALLFTLCITPTAVYADWLRAVPNVYVTHVLWLSVAIASGVWGLSAWLKLEDTPLAMEPDNRVWHSAVTMGGFALAIYLSQRIHSRYARKGG